MNVNLDFVKQMHPLLLEVNNILELLMHLMYDYIEAKQILAQGLADAIHKLWNHILLNKMVLYTALRLLITFTANCSEGEHKIVKQNCFFISLK